MQWFKLVSHTNFKFKVKLFSASSSISCLKHLVLMLGFYKPYMIENLWPLQYIGDVFTHSICQAIKKSSGYLIGLEFREYGGK